MIFDKQLDIVLGLAAVQAKAKFVRFSNGTNICFYVDKKHLNLF